MAEKGPQNVWGDIAPGNLPRSIGVRRQRLVATTWLGFLALRDSSSIWWSRLRFQKSRFKKPVWSIVGLLLLLLFFSCCVYANHQAKFIETSNTLVWMCLSLIKIEDDFQGQKLCFNRNYNSQLWVIDSRSVNCRCFIFSPVHWILNFSSFLKYLTIIVIDAWALGFPKIEIKRTHQRHFWTDLIKRMLEHRGSSTKKGKVLHSNPCLTCERDQVGGMFPDGREHKWMAGLGPENSLFPGITARSFFK